MHFQSGSRCFERSRADSLNVKFFHGLRLWRSDPAAKFFMKFYLQKRFKVNIYRIGICGTDQGPGSVGFLQVGESSVQSVQVIDGSLIFVPVQLCSREKHSNGCMRFSIERDIVTISPPCGTHFRQKDTRPEVEFGELLVDRFIVRSD